MSGFNRTMRSVRLEPDPVEGDACGAAALVPGQANMEDPLAARLALIEDIDAIRALNRAFARQVNAGQPRKWVSTRPSGVALQEFSERDMISLSPDRQAAVCMMHCVVELETAIGPICPLVEMGRAGWRFRSPFRVRRVRAVVHQAGGMWDASALDV
jgi:hypothetical protein